MCRGVARAHVGRVVRVCHHSRALWGLCAYRLGNAQSGEVSSWTYCGQMCSTSRRAARIVSVDDWFGLSMLKQFPGLRRPQGIAWPPFFRPPRVAHAMLFLAWLRDNHGRHRPAWPSKALPFMCCIQALFLALESGGGVLAAYTDQSRECYCRFIYSQAGCLFLRTRHTTVVGYPFSNFRATMMGCCPAGTSLVGRRVDRTTRPPHLLPCLHPKPLNNIHKRMTECKLQSQAPFS